MGTEIWGGKYGDRRDVLQFFRLGDKGEGRVGHFNWESITRVCL
jgi:hypothetical protein